MPSQESITDAKERFITAVVEGISVLMERCGYSRERATSALLRELSRGEFEFIRPTDEEVSDLYIVGYRGWHTGGLFKRNRPNRL